MHPSEATQSVYKTRWTLIEQARDVSGDPAAARRAIERVLLQYRPAVIGAIRRGGFNPADCEDLCQEYLVTTFLRKTLPRAERGKGKFRTFLIHTLRLFLIDCRRRQDALKSGKRITGSLEELNHADEMEAALAMEPRIELDLEIDFAWCMHSTVLAALEKDYAARRQLPVFVALSPHLFEKDAGLDKTLSATLGMNEAAVRQALSRLRERYRDAFLMEVQQIIDEEEDPKTEMKELLKLILTGMRTTRNPAGG